MEVRVLYTFAFQGYVGVSVSNDSTIILPLVLDIDVKDSEPYYRGFHIGNYVVLKNFHDDVEIPAKAAHMLIPEDVLDNAVDMLFEKMVKQNKYRVVDGKIYGEEV